MKTKRDMIRDLFKPVKEKTIYKQVSQLGIEKEFQNVWEYALKRFRFGSLEYGEWNPDKDTRDILEETKEELGDVVIYAGMLLIKINRLINQLEQMKLR